MQPAYSLIQTGKDRRARCTMGSFVLLYASLAISTVSWAAQVSPSNLSFSAIQGGVIPAVQTVGFSKIGRQEKHWSARSNMPWVSVTPATGTISTETDMIVIGVNPGSLSPGTYSATVTITIKGDVSQRYTMLPVSFTVAAGTTTSSTPVIGLSPSVLSFTSVAGGSNPASQSIVVTNMGTGTLSWSSSDNAAWLNLSPVSGTNTGTINAAVNLGGLVAGVYNASVTVSASGASPKTMPVTLTVSAPLTTTGPTGTATLSWMANTESDLGGYKIYSGTASGDYGAPIATLDKATTSYTVSGLQPGSTYFFVITAYDVAGNESLFSGEVTKSIY